MKKMKVIVGVVEYTTVKLHWSFLQETLQSIPLKYEVLVYPNKVLKSIERNWSRKVTVLEGEEEEVPLARAWNILIEKGLAVAEYVLVLNSDVILHREAIELLLKFAEEHKDALLWTMADYEDKRSLNNAEIRSDFDESPHFSAFMVDERLFQEIGKFDENFERAYMEDVDMHLRILLAGKKALKTASALFYHYGSRTIFCDDDLRAKSNIAHMKNREYFKEKWKVDGFGKSAQQIALELKERNS